MPRVSKKYKLNKNYKVVEYCDIYCMYKADDKDKEHLLLTYNPNVKTIFVGKEAVEEDLEEMKLFVENKKLIIGKIMYSKNGKLPIVETN